MDSSFRYQKDDIVIFQRENNCVHFTVNKYEHVIVNEFGKEISMISGTIEIKDY